MQIGGQRIRSRARAENAKQQGVQCGQHRVAFLTLGLRIPPRRADELSEPLHAPSPLWVRMSYNEVSSPMDGPFSCTVHAKDGTIDVLADVRPEGLERE
jgi:hypothetical protein